MSCFWTDEVNCSEVCHVDTATMVSTYSAAFLSSATEYNGKFLGLPRHDVPVGQRAWGIYDPSTGAWEGGATTWGSAVSSAPIAFQSAVIYFSADYLNTFDPETGISTTLQNANTTTDANFALYCDNASACGVVNGTLRAICLGQTYVGAGFDGFFVAGLNSTTPPAGGVAWSKCPEFPVSQQTYLCTWFFNGRFYVSGYYLASGYVNFVYSIDVNGSAWRTEPGMLDEYNDNKNGSGLNPMGTFVLNGLLCYLSADATQTTLILRAYDAVSDAWSTIANIAADYDAMNNVPYSHNAVPIGSNVYVGGGGISIPNTFLCEVPLG